MIVAQRPNRSNETRVSEDKKVSRKTFVIDTNVLIHDPAAIQKFKDNDVVIPLSVLEELDSLKRYSDETGKSSREVIRYIDSLKAEKVGDLHVGVVIPEGPKVRILLNVKSERVEGFPLPLDRSSNRFLLSAFLLKEKGESVVIVSKDFVTRVKAEAMDLESEDYENLKASYEEIYKGFRRIEVQKRDIDQFYKDGTLPLTEGGFRPNEYAMMTSPENSSAVCKYNDKTKKLEPLLQVTREIWGIEQTAEQLYKVTNPLDANEQYNVFLGTPLGCTCGLKNCEHIRAVLNT
jgi:PhoH-like ATPase